MNFRKRSRASLPGFQLAPMIDVIFLLLCFFIASQIFSQWETEVDVTLPTADSGAIPDRLPGEVIINILKDGAVVVNRQTLGDDGLLALLQRVVKYFPGQPVLIRADKETDFQYVIRVLDQCRKCEIWNIAFATGALDKGSATE